MYTLDEYILMSRASKIFRNIAKKNTRIRSFLNDVVNLSGNSDYFIKHSQNDTLEIQRKLINLIQFAIPGSKVTKFLSIRKDGSNAEPFDQLPMFLIEVQDPHIFVPIVLLDSGVIAVSPFENALLKEYSDNSYIIEILPMFFLDEIQGDNPASVSSLLERDSDNLSVRSRLVNLIINIIGKPILGRTDLVHNMFKDTSAYDVDIVAEESVIMGKIKNKYAIESVEEDINDDVSLTDFMPLYVRDEDGFVIIEQTVNVTDGKRLTYIKLKSRDNREELNDRMPSDIYNSVSEPSSYVLKDGDANPRFMLQLADNLYYAGSNKIALLNDSNEIVECIPIAENYAIFDGTSYGTEGYINEFLVDLKKAGIRTTSGLTQVLAPLTRYPRTLIMEILRDVRKFLFVFDKQIEKEDALAYQEKAMNDALDTFSDKVSHWIRVVVFSALSGALLSNVYLGLFAYFFWRIDDANARVRAINRVIKNFRDKINRITAAIEISKQESRYEEVINLMKEKQLHESAIRELVQLKRTNYAKADAEYKEKYPELSIDENISNSGSAY